MFDVTETVKVDGIGGLNKDIVLKLARFWRKSRECEGTVNSF